MYGDTATSRAVSGASSALQDELKSITTRYLAILR
jgi:hypothetical protein